MALNIKNDEVEQLVNEVARLAGETKTEAVRQAMLERRRRLIYRSGRNRRDRVMTLLELDVWPAVPAGELGRRLTEDEEAEILGFGPEGV
jgi:antitoxin VapB